MGDVHPCAIRRKHRGFGGGHSRHGAECEELVGQRIDVSSLICGCKGYSLFGLKPIVKWKLKLCG